MTHYSTNNRVELVQPGLTSKYSGFGRITDPKWIDANIFKYWKFNCDRFHGSKCHKTPSGLFLPPARPRWLIDTWRQCLVLAELGSSYVALSYVWGVVPFFKASKDTLAFLRTNHSLSAENQKSLGIPQTIRDAMSLGFSKSATYGLIPYALFKTTKALKTTRLTIWPQFLLMPL